MNDKNKVVSIFVISCFIVLILGAVFVLSGHTFTGLFIATIAAIAKFIGEKIIKVIYGNDAFDELRREEG